MKSKFLAGLSLVTVLTALLAAGTALSISKTQEYERVCAENEEYAEQMDAVIEDMNYEQTTGCLNYDIYKHYVNSAIANAEDGEQVVHITIGYGTLDHGLKYINDNYGHVNGAQSIKDFAALLKEVFPADEFKICHRGGSSFMVTGTGQYTEEKLLGYYEEMKSRWHDTPYQLAEGDESVEGMSLLYCAAVYPEAGNSFFELKSQIIDRKLILRDITTCGYVLVMDDGDAISSEPSIK